MAKYKSVDEQILVLQRSKRKLIDQLKDLSGLRATPKSVTRSEDDMDEGDEEGRSADEADDDKGLDDSNKWSADKEECFQQIKDSIDEHDTRIAKLEEVRSLEMGDEVEPEDNASMSYNNNSRGEPRLRKASTTSRSGVRSDNFGHNSGDSYRPYAEAVRGNANLEKGDSMAHYVAGLITARHYGWEAALNFVEQRFNNGKVCRALASLTQTAGGALVPQDFYMEIIELLRAKTVIRKAQPLVVGGPYGNLTLGRLSGAATAGYGQELANINVSQETFDNKQLSAKKLTALVPVSNSLIRRAAFGVEQIIRDDLINVLMLAEDLAFLAGTGSSNSPIGLLNRVLSGNTLSFTAVPQTGGYQSANASMLKALAKLEQNASKMIRPVFIGTPLHKYFLAGLTDQVGQTPLANDILKPEGAHFRGVKWFDTIQLGTGGSDGLQGNMILVDMADVVVMDSYTPEIDVSVDATWVQNSTTYSAFQNDSSLLRVIAEHDITIRHSQSLIVMNTDGWVPGFYANSTDTTFANVAGVSYTTETTDNTASFAPSANPTTTNGA